jgi:hypothetical protein
MSWLPNPIACDVCGVVKQPSNHWYYAEIRLDSPQEDNPCFQFWPWDYPAEDRDKGFVHLCGHACAIRKLNEFMGSCSASYAEPPPTADKRTSDPNPYPISIQQQREEN